MVSNMATFTFKAPFNFGGTLYTAGTHEVELVKDWFVDEMIHLGLIVEHEAEVIETEDKAEVKSTKKAE